MILAAGESRRMKVPKMLLTFDGMTMIEKTIRNVINSEVFNTLVVLGSYSREISDAIDHLHVSKCFNKKYIDGMLSSVKCGLVNLPESAEAALILPGDQPLIAPTIINKLIASYRKTGKGIVVPVYKRKRGHPLLIDRKYFDVIINYGKNEVLRSLSVQNAHDVLEVTVNSSSVLKDFDTKEDYLNEINKKKQIWK